MNYSSKRMLLCETRRLSYESSGFFLEEIKNALLELGVTVEECKLHPDFSNLDSFEKLCYRSYDVILDMNSIIPDMLLEDNSYLIDHFQGPFYNYILDHPMHVHPMLSAPCNNQRVICLDESHKTWIENNLPNIPQTIVLPLGVSDTTFKPNWEEYLKRKYSILFPATYQSIEGLEYHVANSKGIKKECYQDRLHREQKRQRLMKDLLSHDLDVYVLGRNWEDFSLVKHPHFHYLGACSYKESLAYMKQSKIVMHLQPGFESAPHDRIFNTYGSGAVLCGDSCGLLERAGDVKKSYLKLNINVADCYCEAIKKHLQNPEEIYNKMMMDRQEIIKNQNYVKRMQNLLEILFDNL